MNARDELVDLIWDEAAADRVRDGKDLKLVPVVRAKVEAMADKVIAAGWRKTCTITTVEELDALGFQAVVRDAEDYVLERWGEPEEQMWATPMNSAWIRSSEVTLPAKVLYEPAAQP